MTNRISARLRALSYHIDETGLADDVDAKSCTEAADHIDAQVKRISELEAAIKRQAAASKALRQHTPSEVQHLNDKDRTEYIAGKTLDGERAANAMLTDEIDAQDAKIKALVEALGKLCFEVAGLQAFEQGVRHEIGNANYAAIMTRLNDGGVAIAAAKETT